MRRHSIESIVLFNYQVKNETSVSLNEGDSPVFLYLQSHTPPAFLCDVSQSVDDCTLYITAQLQADDTDLACLRGGAVVQAVTGSLEASASCGFVINAHNWQDVQRLPLEAERDGIVDGDQTRYLDLGVNITSSSGVADVAIAINTFQVSI